MLKKCKQNRIRFKCLQKLIFPESFPLPVFDTLSPCTYLQELLWSLLLPIPWQNLMIAGFPIKTRKLVRIMFNIPNKIKYCKLRIWKVETVLSLVRHALLLNTFLTCINEGVFFFFSFFLNLWEWSLVDEKIDDPWTLLEKDLKPSFGSVLG